MNGMMANGWRLGRRVKNLGAILVFDALAAYDDPSQEDLDKCIMLGQAPSTSINFIYFKS